MQAFLYQPQIDGVFVTGHTSTWLKKDTGITAPYIDTRLNETFSLVLGDFAQFVPSLNLQKFRKRYVEYLLKISNQRELLYVTKNGYFFPDYQKINSSIKTHTSLNHQLGIVNEMFNAYSDTLETKYLDVCRSMLGFIKDTKENWIDLKEGDLFYGIKESKQATSSGFEFFGKDYVYVTLIDLLICIKNCRKFMQIDVGFLADLVDSKIKYLAKTQYSISNEPAGIAPGEPINSVKKINILLEDLKMQIL